MNLYDGGVNPEARICRSHGNGAENPVLRLTVISEKRVSNSNKRKLTRGSYRSGW